MCFEKPILYDGFTYSPPHNFASCFPKCEHSGILVKWYLAAEGLKIILEEEEVELFSPCCREYELDCPGNETE